MFSPESQFGGSRGCRGETPLRMTRCAFEEAGGAKAHLLALSYVGHLTRLAAGACVLVGLFGACTAPRPNVLDGPVHYFTRYGPGSDRTLDLAVDGSARLQGDVEAGGPYDF